MKQILLIGTLLALCARAGGADFIRFSETYRESLKRVSDGYFVDYEEVTANSATVSGSITVPGLSTNRLDEFPSVEFAIGPNSYSFEPQENATADRLEFTFLEQIDEGEYPRSVKVGSFTLTRAGDRLSFNFSNSRLPESIAASTHAEPEYGSPGSRRVRGRTEFSLLAGPFAIQQNLYYDGTASFRRQRVGSGYDAITYTLATVTISGSIDDTRPRLAFTAPRPNQRVSNEVFTVTGTATDNGEVSEIFVSVNEGEYQSVGDFDGRAWSAEAALSAGTNVIKAYCVDAESNHSATGSVRCFFVVTNALALIVGEGGTVTGVSNRQALEVGRGYVATARPGPTNLFSHWTSSDAGLSSNAALRFLMSTGLTLQAHFIANPWLPHAGTCHGLFLPDADVTATNAGSITLQMTSLGKITGKLRQGGKPRRFSGQVQLDGSISIQLAGRPAVTVQLQFDLAGGTGVQGVVSNAAWQSGLHAERQSPVGPVAGVVGKHTIVIPGEPADAAATYPAGDGVGVVTINKKGLVTLGGHLGDGTPLALGGAISRDGRLAVHASLLSGRSVFLGWADVFSNAPTYTITATNLLWSKPSGLAKQKTYPGGFSLSKSMYGARYLVPVREENIVNWTRGAVLLDGGGLGATFSNAVEVAGRKLTVPGDTNRLSLKIQAGTGRVSGSVIHPVTRRSVALRGIVLRLPEGDVGSGWFISNSESGYLNLRMAE